MGAPWPGGHQGEGRKGAPRTVGPQGWPGFHLDSGQGQLRRPRPRGPSLSTCACPPTPRPPQDTELPRGQRPGVPTVLHEAPAPHTVLPPSLHTQASCVPKLPALHMARARNKDRAGDTAPQSEQAQQAPHPPGQASIAFSQKDRTSPTQVADQGQILTGRSDHGPKSPDTLRGSADDAALLVVPGRSCGDPRAGGCSGPPRQAPSPATQARERCVHSSTQDQA